MLTCGTHPGIIPAGLWNCALPHVSMISGLRMPAYCKEVESKHGNFHLLKSFFSTLKFEYVEVFYNRIMKPSGLGYKSPVQYKKKEPKRNLTRRPLFRGKITLKSAALLLLYSALSSSQVPPVDLLPEKSALLRELDL
jgi:hypothetical protein